MIDPEETPCPVREDGLHCDHWYDGEGCHACGEGPMSEEARVQQGMVEGPPRDPRDATRTIRKQLCFPILYGTFPTLSDESHAAWMTACARWINGRGPQPPLSLMGWRIHVLAGGYS